MGDWYELKVLAGIYYLEYCNEDTGWNSVALQLTKGQLAKIEEFNIKEQELRCSFFKDFLGEAKK